MSAFIHLLFLLYAISPRDAIHFFHKILCVFATFFAAYTTFFRFLCRNPARAGSALWITPRDFLQLFHRFYFFYVKSFHFYFRLFWSRKIIGKMTNAPLFFFAARNSSAAVMENSMEIRPFTKKIVPHMRGVAVRFWGDERRREESFDAARNRLHGAACWRTTRARRTRATRRASTAWRSPGWKSSSASTAMCSPFAA